MRLVREPEATLLPLVEGARRGDRAAAQTLLRSLLPRVSNLIRYFLRGDDGVDDLAQDSLVAVLKGLETYRMEGRFEAWVDRVVARVTFAALRKRRALALQPVGDVVEETPAPGDTEDYLARRRLVRALDALSIEQRAALVLHFIVGMSVPELADELSCPAETVRSRLRLGMERLRALFAPEKRDEPRSSHVAGK